MAKKPVPQLLEDCCGQCTYFKRDTMTRGSKYLCWQSAPVFVELNNDTDEVWVRGGFTEAHYPACAEFKPAKVN